MREDRLTAVDRAIQVYQARRAALQKRVLEDRSGRKITGGLNEVSTSYHVTVE